jgi:hypothetical protein
MRARTKINLEILKAQVLAAQFRILWRIGSILIMQAQTIADVVADARPGKR